MLHAQPHHKVDDLEKISVRFLLSFMRQLALLRKLLDRLFKRSVMDIQKTKHKWNLMERNPFDKSKN